MTICRDCIKWMQFGAAIRRKITRKATKKRKVFPTDESALKVVYLVTQAAAKKWTMPIQNWKQAINRFAIIFEGRLPIRGLTENSITQNS